MKKKLIISMISVLTVCIILLSVLFCMLTNYNYLENIKKSLQNNNQLISEMLDTNNIKDMEVFFKKNYDKSDMRVTLINKNGKVLYDSEHDTETMDNHYNRDEIIAARNDSIGYSTRYSKTIKKDMLYCAAKLSDGSFIRSSIPISVIENFEFRFLKYYIVIVAVVFLIGLMTVSKISNVFINPIEELDKITARVANGELDIRVKKITKDEIGKLAETFNDMAHKMQTYLNAAKDKENKLSAILKSMDSGVIAVDNNYKLIMINPYAEEIFGIKKNIIGQNFMDSIRNFEFEDILMKSQNEEVSTEIRLEWPRERELKVKVADIIDDNIILGKVAVLQDITDIKKLENIRSQFVANVSHELKTPLTSIKGFAETLKEVDDDTTKEKFLDIINDEAERLTRLINDILILSNIENGEEIILEPVNINKEINNVYNLMKNIADKKNIKINIVGEEVESIYSDKDRFKQMMINLVDNAIKYSEPDTNIIISKSEKNNNIILSVKDEGVGISREHLDRLFERFYRVDKARSRSQGGTGLGLAIVKHIVIGFNGTIDVESELGKGSKFTIVIPIKRG
ncbi:MAG: ATP-binding protein [Bacillota bacterium]|nr:ATP-binding protein [Bacillota bacterium]